MMMSKGKCSVPEEYRSQEVSLTMVRLISNDDRCQICATYNVIISEFREFLHLCCEPSHCAPHLYVSELLPCLLCRLRRDAIARCLTSNCVM
jgi:hypothetical protein